jgi:hypothetical protein
MVGGLLYLTTPYRTVVAFEPETGKTVWRYDAPGNGQLSLRGAEYRPGDGKSPAPPMPRCAWPALHPWRKWRCRPKLGAMADIATFIWRLLRQLRPGRWSSAFALSAGADAFARHDYTDALSHWQHIADHGNATAQYNLGLLHEQGLGVSKDEGEASRWYLRSASRGYAPAQYNLACMYSTGRGVARDHVAATGWYRKSADQGHAPAQHGLAFMYEIGQGVSQDYTEAANWYRKAALQNWTDAQFGLGRLHAQGQGVPLDYAEAHRLFSLAARGYGDDEDRRQQAIKCRDQAAIFIGAGPSSFAASGGERGAE